MCRELVMNQADPDLLAFFLTVLALVALSRKRDRVAELALKILGRLKRDQ